MLSIISNMLLHLIVSIYYQATRDDGNRENCQPKNSRFELTLNSLIKMHAYHILSVK